MTTTSHSVMSHVKSRTSKMTAFDLEVEEEGGEEVPDEGGAGEPAEGLEEALEEEQELEDEPASEFDDTTGRRVSHSLLRKRRANAVYRNQDNVTPQNLRGSRHLLTEDVFSHAAFQSRYRIGQKRKSVAMMTVRRSSSRLGLKIYATTVNLDDIRIDHTIDTEVGVEIDKAKLEQAPSAFYLPKMWPPSSYPPQYTVVLKETETIYLFSMPCYSSEKGTEEADVAEAENEFYLYLTFGKGRNRKTIGTETQTESKITQSRHTIAKKPQKRNASSFASVWDMYDTYAAQDAVKEEEPPDEMVMFQTTDPSLLRKNIKIVSAEKEDPVVKIVKNPRFQDALVIVERVLSSNFFAKQQKTYRGLNPFNPLSPDLKYLYTLHLLWVSTCQEVAGRPILDFCFNPQNSDLIATAYGKFLYADTLTGLICVWCTKNPRKPERVYPFKVAATAVSFSEQNPNWLACGFDDGNVLILDIQSFEKRIIAKCRRDTNPCFTPIWNLAWWKDDKQNEYVMATSEDGRISRYISTKAHDLIYSNMMRVMQAEGKIRGMFTIRPQMESEIPILRTSAALCYGLHPSDSLVYLIGTDRGCVHKCSLNYLNQDMDIFQAHIGPVYDLKFSPFWKSLLATCGADWAIRLWLDGIDEPIVTMKTESPIYSIAWSPSNSCILVSVSGNLLCVWDLRRKAFSPCCEYTFSSSDILTKVSFCSSGDNLVVTDSAGNMWMFHLDDMPISPFYQKKILYESIEKVLSTRPDISRKIQKLKTFKAAQGIK